MSVWKRRVLKGCAVVGSLLVRTGVQPAWEFRVKVCWRSLPHQTFLAELLQGKIKKNPVEQVLWNL